MLETASMLCFLLAFALLHTAAPARFPARIQPTPALLAAMKAGAVLAALVGVASWMRTESMAAALLVALTAVSVAATIVVLLAPIFPRVLWVLALACPPVIVALLAHAGCRG